MVNVLLSVLALIIILVLWIIIYDSNRFVVSYETIIDKRIKKDLKFVVLADLHNKSYGPRNEKLINAIKELNPDFIIVAGDIPIANPKKSLDVAIKFVEDISKLCPVYYGYGNHEHRLSIYPEVYGDMNEIYEGALADNNICVLKNDKKLLEDFGLCIYGALIDKSYYKRFEKTPMADDYLGEILGDIDNQYYNILIAHNPDYFENYASWGADLTLSGHIHGGMVRIPLINKGVVSPAVKLFPKYDGGKFFHNGKMMLLSRGLGMHTIPIRFFNPGEICLVELKNH